MCALGSVPNADHKCFADKDGGLAVGDPIKRDGLGDESQRGKPLFVRNRKPRDSAFRFSLTFGLEVFFLGILMMATMTLAMSRERGADASDRLMITRATSEKLFEVAFAQAKLRRLYGTPGHVTLLDKANVLRSNAFLRKVFDDVAARHPDVGKAPSTSTPAR